MKSFKQFLEEKLIVFNNGAKYGQIVFLAGGAASGKGFAVQNFMEGEKFKVRDVDEWKGALLRIDDMKKNHPEIRGLDLRMPKDVFALHAYVRKLGIKNKSLDGLLSDVNTDRLPNILFDVTLKDVDDIADVVPRLLQLGYNTTDIHLVWVLTNYRIAIKQNADRSRVVPEDILLQTHEGAARTVNDLLHGKVERVIPNMLNGTIKVILNNKENTIYFDNNRTVIKDFKYLTLKEPGKPVTSDINVQSQLAHWIVQNVPKTFLTKDLLHNYNKK